ncbi:hypothetical protein HAX54_010849 [Datura stramonium]|uniref:Uncharacterized protein n=1 Tax=Datura stramonium TaxID=4076 RepID=A0ABS8WY59_DATST|nr:hypothetical protein [Datura stramonium]
MLLKRLNTIIDEPIYMGERELVVPRLARELGMKPRVNHQCRWHVLDAKDRGSKNQSSRSNPYIPPALEEVVRGDQFLGSPTCLNRWGHGEGDPTADTNNNIAATTKDWIF